MLAVWAKHPLLGLSLISFCPQAEISFMQREKTNLARTITHWQIAASHDSSTSSSRAALVARCDISVEH
jgi:hypothetical protein